MLATIFGETVLPQPETCAFSQWFRFGCTSGTLVTYTIESSGVFKIRDPAAENEHGVGLQ